MFKVIDDFISKEDQDEIERYIFDSSFPYRFHKIHNYGDGFKSPLQLTHHLYMHDEGASPHFPIIKPVYASLMALYGDITLFRAKVNVTTPMSPYTQLHSQEPHVDLQYENGAEIDHMVCVYYINNSDGPTLFFHDGVIDGKIEPKKGRALIFNGKKVHAGSNPIESPFRAIINIDFRAGLNQIPW